MRAFFVQIFQQSQNETRKMTFVRKIRTYNVDEIDTYMVLLLVRIDHFVSDVALEPWRIAHL